MPRHELKTWPSYFEAIVRGEKPFEARRNDRDFAVGDTLVLMEWDPGPRSPGAFTGRQMERVVTYVMHGDQFGIEPGYCVLGIKEATSARSEAAGGEDKTCPCGTPLVRDGVTVKSHWIGAVCDDCEAAMFRKHAEGSNGRD